jgi:hypothetical protein
MEYQGFESLIPVVHPIRNAKVKYENANPPSLKASSYAEATEDKSAEQANAK